MKNLKRSLALGMKPVSMAILAANAFGAEPEWIASFDSLSASPFSSDPVPQGYGGVRWSAVRVQDATDAAEGSILRRGLVSGSNVAIMGGSARISSGHAFSLRSAWVTAYSEDRTMIVTAWVGTRRLGAKSFATGLAPRKLEINFENVTAVDFSDSGAVIDDIVFAPPAERLRGAPDFLAPGQLIFTPGAAFSLASADFNGDRRMDLAIANVGGVRFLLGTAGANFVPHDTVGSATLGVGDFTGEGRPDLILMGYLSSFIAFDGFATTRSGPVSGPEGAVVIGDFGGGVRTVAYGADCVAGDFDGDGDLDVVYSSPAPVAMRLNNGSGRFGEPVAVGGGLGVEQGVIAYDFEGDGDLDVATTLPDQDAVALFLNNGRGGFPNRRTFPAGLDRPTALALRDLDGDRQADLVLRSAFSGLSVLRGRPGGTFAAAEVIVPGASPIQDNVGRGITINDFNQDGRPDIAFISGTEVMTLLNIARPRLGITAIADLARIDWPEEFGRGMIFETATSLEENAWGTHAFPPTEGTAYDSGRAQMRFFRLRRPD